MTWENDKNETATQIYSFSLRCIIKLVTAKETSVNQCSDRGLYHLEICTFDICAILLIGEPGI